jgi:hypothetical protein
MIINNIDREFIKKMGKVGEIWKKQEKCGH